ncbi:MAG: hemerythrin domain-containing protein [Cyclobacteriaceae bacterium]
MRIIDPKTGKRLVNADAETLKSIKKKDPIKKHVEKDLEKIENSPMDPPDAYNMEKTSGDSKLPELIQQFKTEHLVALGKISDFESALAQFRNYGYKFDKKINEVFGDFFEFFDKNLLAHNIKEEKILFPLLHKRLVDSGEHSQSQKPRTGVDLLEDDHIKFIQLGALSFNLLGLGTRIQDETSRMLIFDVAYNNGRELIELLKLHIFREDNTLFPNAVKLINMEEFDQMQEELKNLDI